MKKLFFLFLVLFSTFFIFDAKADYNSELKVFIDNMAVNFDRINDIKDENEWTDSAYKYANEILDIKWISNFILGKHRRTLNKEQIDEFVRYYSVYLLKNYLDTLALFSKENISITSIRESKKDTYFVGLNIKTKDNEIKTELRIVKKKNIFYITDIIAEGVSFINSQRNEINSFIDNNGFDALIKKIK